MIWRLVSRCKNNTRRSSWDSKAALAFSAILHPPFHPSPSFSTLHPPLLLFTFLFPLPFSCSTLLFHTSPSSSKLHPVLPDFTLLFTLFSLQSSTFFFHLSSSSSIPLLPHLRQGRGDTCQDICQDIPMSYTSPHSYTAPTPQHTTLLSGSFSTWCFSQPYDVFQETQEDNAVCPPNLLFDHVVHLYTGLEDTVTYSNLEEVAQEPVGSPIGSSSGCPHTTTGIVCLPLLQPNPESLHWQWLTLWTSRLPRTA